MSMFNRKDRHDFQVTLLSKTTILCQNWATKAKMNQTKKPQQRRHLQEILATKLLLQTNLPERQHLRRQIPTLVAHSQELMVPVSADVAI